MKTLLGGGFEKESETRILGNYLSGYALKDVYYDRNGLGIGGSWKIRDTIKQKNSANEDAEIFWQYFVSKGYYVSTLKTDHVDYLIKERERWRNLRGTGSLDVKYDRRESLIPTHSFREDDLKLYVYKDLYAQNTNIKKYEWVQQNSASDITQLFVLPHRLEFADDANILTGARVKSTTDLGAILTDQNVLIGQVPNLINDLGYGSPSLIERGRGLLSYPNPGLRNLNPQEGYSSEKNSKKYSTYSTVIGHRVVSNVYQKTVFQIFIDMLYDYAPHFFGQNNSVIETNQKALDFAYGKDEALKFVAQSINSSIGRYYKGGFALKKGIFVFDFPKQPSNANDLSNMKSFYNRYVHNSLLIGSKNDSPVGVDFPKGRWLFPIRPGLIHLKRDAEQIGDLQRMLEIKFNEENPVVVEVSFFKILFGERMQESKKYLTRCFRLVRNSEDDTPLDSLVDKTEAEKSSYISTSLLTGAYVPLISPPPGPDDSKPCENLWDRLVQEYREAESEANRDHRAYIELLRRFNEGLDSLALLGEVHYVDIRN